MRTTCITVNDDNYTRAGGLYGTDAGPPIPLTKVRQHFAERGVEAQFFYGLHGTRLGIETRFTYEVDNPGSGYKIGSKTVGCCLSHRAVWAACLMLPSDDERFFILEDDAKFPENWKPRLDQALQDAGDFDVLYVGSCCTVGKPKTHIAGEVYEVKYPLCTHGVIIHRRALMTLMQTFDEARCYAPIDIALAFHSLPKLNRAYTVLPRLPDQWNTEIAE